MSTWFGSTDSCKWCHPSQPSFRASGRAAIYSSVRWWAVAHLDVWTLVGNCLVWCINVAALVGGDVARSQRGRGWWWLQTSLSMWQGNGGGRGRRCQHVCGMTWHVHVMAGGGGCGRCCRHVWVCMACLQGGLGSVGRIRTEWKEGGWGLGQPNSDTERGRGCLPVSSYRSERCWLRTKR